MRRAATLIVLGILSALAVASCTDAKAANARYAQNGDRLAAQQRLDQAILEYRNALKHDQFDGLTQLKLADLYFRTNQPELGFNEYIRAADLLQDRADVQVRAGHLLMWGGRPDDARAKAERVLAKDPKNIDALILLGNALVGVNNIESAIDQVEEALALDPGKSSTHTTLGALQLEKGDRAQAEISFKKAVALAPDSLDAQLALANFYWASGQTETIERALRRAEQINPKSQIVQRSLAVLYLSTDRRTEAEHYLKIVADASSEVGPRLTLADFYVSTGRRGEALALLKQLEQRGDAFPAVPLRLAQFEYTEGRRETGHAMLDQVLIREPNLAGALLLKAQWLLADGLTSEALDRAKAAVANAPKWATGHYVLGTIHATRHEAVDAEAAFTEVLKLNPRAVHAQLQLSRLHLATGNTDVSIELAEEALRNQAGNPGAHLARARGLVARGDLAQAAPAVAALVQRYPSVSAVQSLLGALEFAKQNWEGARRAFERALALDPKSTEALVGLVRLDIKSGKTAEARARIDSALANDTDEPGILLLAATAYSETGDFPKAERVLRKALDRDPSNVDGYMLLLRAYAAQKRVAAALQEIEVESRVTTALSVHTLLGILLQAHNRTDDAQAQYEKLLRAQPRAAVAANNLAWIYAATGRHLEDAVRLATIAKEGLPHRPEIDDTLGWIYLKKGLPVLAITSFERCVKRDPSNPQYHFHLGLAYSQTGETDRARRSLEQALKLQPDFADSEEAKHALAALPR